MTDSFAHQLKVFLALSGVILGLCSISLFSSPANAEASTSNYCGGSLGGYLSCWGAGRTLYATYGWGDQHSVCVWAAWSNGGPGSVACSGGTSGVYNPVGGTNYMYPAIQNNGQGVQGVQGVAYQP